MKRYATLILIGLFFLPLVLLPCPSFAAPYYEGKVITIVVGYGPGGGYDRMARILSKHLSKHIPGKPAILVQNMPGADSMISANYLYNIAKPDGLTIGTFNRFLSFAQLEKAAGVKFDLRKFAWIGSAASESMVLLIRADLPYKTVDDIVKAKAEIILGDTGPAGSGRLFPTLLKNFMGINFKFVTYPSGNDIMLALERKEIDARCGSYSGYRPLVDRGVLRPVVRGSAAVPGIENLPVDEKLVKNALGAQLMAIGSAPDKMGRPYMAPPGTPEAVMNILRNAFANAAKDPLLQEDARRLQMDVEYLPAKEVEKILRLILDQPPNVVKEFLTYSKS